MVHSIIQVIRFGFTAFQPLRGSAYRMFGPASIDDVVLLHRGSNYIVVNKHYDIKINSDDPADEVTVANQLAKKFPHLVDHTVSHQFRFVHRLDFSTSGALCIGLNKQASAVVQRLFTKRKVKKEYLALVRGHMTEDHVSVDRGIYPNTLEGCTHMMCYSDGSDPPPGVKMRNASTEIRVLQRGSYDGEPATKIQLVPTTGRRHQLRLHCLSLGHPIVGDYTYSQRMDTGPYRMMLHAHQLHIPSSLEDVNVTAPDPFITELDPKWVANPS